MYKINYTEPDENDINHTLTNFQINVIGNFSNILLYYYVTHYSVDWQSRGKKFQQCNTPKKNGPKLTPKILNTTRHHR